MATIKEIAMRAGVSIGTVDRVLHNRGRVSEQTKETILRLVDELGYKPNSVAKGLAIMRKKYRLTFFTVDPTYRPFFGRILEGAKLKAAELAQYGVEVEIIPISLEETTLREWDRETDGIAMMPMDILEPVYLWAKENQIPVVSFNMPLPAGECLAYVGCDYMQAGKIAAGLCAIAGGGRGKIAVLSEGDNSTISYRDREKGFRQEMQARYPDLEVTESYTTTADCMSLEAAAEKLLAEHRDFDVVYLINPGNYSICKTIHERMGHRNVKIITNDLMPMQYTLLEEGMITATICQEPEQQGAESLQILFDHVANGIIPEKTNSYTNLTIHILQNI